MKQIYVGTTEKVYLNVFKDGVATNTDALPTYSISIVGSNVAPRTGTATASVTGVYYVLTEAGESTAEQTLKVVWTYLVSADTYTFTDYISVVTPYVSFSEAKALAPEGTTDAEIEHAEQFARYNIEQYTGQSFGQRQQVVDMHGSDKTTLVLPHRIIRLDNLYIDDELVWTLSPAYDGWGKNIEITDTNYGLLAKPGSDSISFDNNFYVGSTWGKTHKFTLDGLFGWETPPQEVVYASKLLVDDYFCKETAWKKRFVDQINASDWRVVFNTKQFQGTGNFYVDQILRQFKSIGMVMV